MDVDINDLDNNNNVIQVLNNQNDHNQPDIDANINMEVNENIENNAAEIVEALHNIGQQVEDIRQNEGVINDIIKIEDRNAQNVASNTINARRPKKRKRQKFNLNKNKKWNKSYKRQKSTITSKSDAENLLQNTRNKHLYAKVPKIIFNNKPTMHRGGGVSKFFLPDKRPRKDIIVPPTKFLLGGNISDPLNLNSLQDEAYKVSMGAVTPKSSPKVEVIIPPNIYDPLHLLDPVDSVEYEKQLVSPLKARRLNKQRSRKKKIRKNIPDAAVPAAIAVATTKAAEHDIQDISTTIDTGIIAKNSLPKTKPPKCVSDILSELSDASELSGTLEAAVEEGLEIVNSSNIDDNLGSSCSSSAHKRKFSENFGNSNVSSCSVATNGIKKLKRFDSKDKIVSPVIPQPGAWKRPLKVLFGAPRNRIRTSSASGRT